jgi:hypothetical protein
LKKREPQEGTKGSRRKQRLLFYAYLALSCG